MSFSDELPNPTIDLVEGREWRSKLKSGANRLSFDVFKIKQQYYDRRPSSMDVSHFYSTGSSGSATSITGISTPAQGASLSYSTGGSGFLRRDSMMPEDEDDRDEITYSSARLSFVAGVSPACGLGPWDPPRSSSDTYGSDEGGALHQDLLDQLYGYESEMDADDLAAISPSAEDIVMASAAHRLPRSTSIFRSFEGWGFDADEIQNMDPTEPVEDEPEARPIFRFDSSISRNARDRSLSTADVDPLDHMDTSRTLVESHPLPIPLRFLSANRKRSSAIYIREQQRKRRMPSLQSISGPNTRQSSLQYSPARSGQTSFSNDGGEGFTSSPYRPSIVLTESPIFDLSESEPATRNASFNSNLRMNAHGGSIGSTPGRRSSVFSRKSASSSEQSPTHSKVKKSIFGFLSKKTKKLQKQAPQMPARLPDTQFVPLLHDISEVSSISSGEPSVIMTATAAPIAKVQKAPDGKPRMLPVRTEYNMRRASFSLQMSDEDIYDPIAPVAPPKERRNSWVQSQTNLIALETRRNSSVYEMEDIQPGDEESPPCTPMRRYSLSHVSNPESYVPPRANWYKSDWGLDEQ
ncbi:hypothetical protein ABW19_dt0210042 [Dactylella cylindrospora]|nr:hypothetical protein ABW19_dt0210042 [Dactylella cylindrospora]